MDKKSQKAAEFRERIKENGAIIAELAEPLIKASCRIVGEEEKAVFDKEHFIFLLSRIANAVLGNHQVKIITEKIHSDYSPASSFRFIPLRRNYAYRKIRRCQL